MPDAQILQLTADASPAGGDAVETQKAGGGVGSSRYVLLSDLAKGLTLQPGTADNTILADMAQDTIKGRVSAGAGDPEDLTATQVRTLINVEDGATADQVAGEVTFSPVGTLSATDVQAALAELDSEKEVAGTAAAAIVAHEGAASPHTKTQVGLGNVDNTSDANKPVSTAQQTALDAKANQTVSINDQTGTTYQLVLTDQSKLIRLNNASAITLTVPTNATVAFPTGSVIALQQQGAGQVTVAAAGGVTVNSNGAKLKLNGQYAGASLVKTGTDTWWLSGNTAA